MSFYIAPSDCNLRIIGLSVGPFNAYAIRGGADDERRYRCRRLDKEGGSIHFVRAPEGQGSGTHNHLEKPLLEWLNEFGEEGWEMVTLTRGYGSKSKSASSGRYTFKRKIV